MYGLDDRGSILDSSEIHFLLATASRPLSNGYRGLFPWGQSSRDVKLTTHLHPAPRLRMRGATPPLLHWVVLKAQGHFYRYEYNRSLIRSMRFGFRI